jgi:hypothetical protein
MRLSSLLATLLLTSTLAGAPAPRTYHLELEATPAGAFPWLGRFGDVDLHVYPEGVRAEALWIHAFSRVAAKDITVANPLARMYVEVGVDEVSGMLQNLAGSGTDLERNARPKLGPKMKGTVKGIPATRHRLLYGPKAWIDVWTTEAIPQNRQMQLLVKNVVSGISPGTAEVASKLPGTPIYVELNFRRFQKVPLVRLKKLTYTNDGHADALTLGRLYVRAGVFEKILGGK